MHSGYFYDGQVRRFLTQFIRLVSNFQVEFRKDGVRSLRRVPVIYGDGSRQAQQIIHNNSENIMNSVPAMAAYISEMKYDRDRVQNPTHVSKLNLRQRAIDPTTGAYTTQQGDAVTVERLMPVPYTLGVKLDIWTSNTEQKLQLLEQIQSIFNPAVEIQSTDNYIDWTSLSYVLLTGVSWSSRTVPVGTAEQIDIATLSFEIPIWITPPALVKKMNIIHKVIASIYGSDGNLAEDILDSNLFSRQVITPLDYSILIRDIRPGVESYSGEIELVRYSSPTVEPLGEQVVRRIVANSTGQTFTVSSSDDIEVGMEIRIGGQDPIAFVTAVGENIITANVNVAASADQRVSFTKVMHKIGVSENWRGLVDLYGRLVSGSSQIVAEMDDGSEIRGTVAFHPTNPNVLLFNIFRDYVEDNTLNVTAIIDPTKNRPGKQLDLPVYGTRYLLTKDYNSPIPGVPTSTSDPVTGATIRQYPANSSIAESEFQFNWLGADGVRIQALAGDIIEYNGSFWTKVFDSASEDSIHYVTNLTTGIQYRWSDGRWAKAYEGVYEGGKWQLQIYPT